MKLFISPISFLRLKARLCFMMIFFSLIFSSSDKFDFERSSFLSIICSSVKSLKLSMGSGNFVGLGVPPSFFFLCFILVGGVFKFCLVTTGLVCSFDKGSDNIL